MAFKSEIHVAELASIRTGHAEGDIYYILDNGMLGDIPCKPGTFVKWHNDAWQIQPDEHYALASATDGEIAQAIDNLLDNGQASETIVVAVPSSQSSNYTVGNYYEVQGKVARLRTKTDGDNVTQLTFGTTSGLLDAINDIVKDSGVKILYGSSNPGGTTYPDAEDVVNAVEHGKEVIIFWNASGRLYVYHLEYMFGYAASGDDSYVFRCIKDYNETKILTQVEGVYTWSREMGNKIPYPSSIAAQYSDQSTYAEGDYCMYLGQLYVCITAITTAEDWTPAHWHETSAAEQIGSIDYAMFYGTVAIGPVYTFPDESKVRAAVDSGKTVIIKMSGVSGDTWYQSALKYGDQYVFCETMHPERQLRLEYVGSAYQWSFFFEPVHNSVVTFTGTLDPDASPVDYSGMPNSIDVANAIANGNEVRLELTNSSGCAVFYRLINGMQYNKIFAAMDGGHIGKSGYVNLIIMSYAGPGNPWHWSVAKALQQALNTQDKAESDISNGHMEIASNNVVTTLTLTTVNAVTMHTSDYSLPPNFAVQIDNTGNSNDVTIDVQHGPDSLKYSVAGGNVVGAGKYMQLTCVGSCWTLAEFTVPTP